jgi:hypothetical protein
LNFDLAVSALIPPFLGALTELHKDVFAGIHGHLVEILSHQNLHILSIPVIRNIFRIQVDLKAGDNDQMQH